MTFKPSTWTQERRTQLRALFRAGKSRAEIADALGVTRKQVRQRMLAEGFVTSRLAALRTTPASVWDERDARLSARQDLTGSFFGDPPMGFSALDRR
jgi:predicted ArsR family transcriptional regulator